MRDSSTPKEVYWIGAARDDLRRFPEPVRYVIGYALYLAQTGGKHPHAKPLRGFGSAGVLEVVEDHDGDTYRAVYTVTFKEAVYVLHAFQKKSKRGIGTPKPDIDTVTERLKAAAKHYAASIQRKRG
jgi:phage-related protein